MLDVKNIGVSLYFLLIAASLISCSSVDGRVKSSIPKMSFAQAEERTEALAKLMAEYKSKNGHFPRNSSYLAKPGSNGEFILLTTGKRWPGTYCFLPEGLLVDPLARGASIIAFTTDAVPSEKNGLWRFVIYSNAQVLLMGEGAFNALLNPQLESFNQSSENPSSGGPGTLIAPTASSSAAKSSGGFFSTTKPKLPAISSRTTN